MKNLFLSLSKSVFFVIVIFSIFSCAKPKQNQTMMQFFDWNYPADQSFYQFAISQTEDLSKLGITGVWLPPAYKCSSQDDVGYGCYDLYDLGEFLQKGIVSTKYGTKDEYLETIKSFHKNNIKVYADVVLNHKAWGDETEDVKATEVKEHNRTEKLGESHTISAWSKFNFSGRQNKYSSFKWNHNHFDGIDWDEKLGKKGIYLFDGKNWDSVISKEKGNYDYIMFADYDFENTDVVEELTRWGIWYTNFTDVDGFRIDAVKHIKYDFFKDWLLAIKKSTKKDIFSVAEYWGSATEMNLYLEKFGKGLSLFDFPLQVDLGNIEKSLGTSDLRTLFKSRFLFSHPESSVTFVENHDTQRRTKGNIAPHPFRTQSYAFILTRKEGTPCVFFGDYYGIPSILVSLKDEIDILLLARKNYAYGKQHDYEISKDAIAWTREGDKAHHSSGLACLIHDNAKGKTEKVSMFVGKSHKGETWENVFETNQDNKNNIVQIDSNGYGEFFVKPLSTALYIKKE